MLFFYSCSTLVGFHRVKHDEKPDVYDFGVILLEIIVGRPLDSRDEVDVERDQVRLMFYVSSLFPYLFMNICINDELPHCT